MTTIDNTAIVSAGAHVSHDVTIGAYVVIGPDVVIGSGAQIAAKSAVFNDVPENTKLRGVPAIPWREFSRREIWLGRIAELAKRVDELEKKLGERR